MLYSIGVIARWRIYHIQSQPKSLINHLRYNSRQQWAGQLQAWVGINLNQPRIEFTINHEIQPKYLKIMFEPFRRYLNENTFNRI